MSKKFKDTSLIVKINEYEGEVVEIKFQHTEKYHQRLVHFTETALLIAHIKRWVELYRKEIIPNFEQAEFSTTIQNLSRLDEMKGYISVWSDRLPKLIPENNEINKWKKLHFVFKNYTLLEPNKALTYNQALFILLGLNAYELDFSCIDLPVFDDRPTDELSAIENLFWNTRQNQELRQSAYVQHGKISSENLQKLAMVNGFFQEDTWVSSNFTIVQLKTKPNKESKKKVANRKIIEAIAKGIKKDYPRIANYILAGEVKKIMMEEYDIELSIETIRTGYSGSLKKS